MGRIKVLLEVSSTCRASSHHPALSDSVVGDLLLEAAFNCLQGSPHGIQVILIFIATICPCSSCYHRVGDHAASGASGVGLRSMGGILRDMGSTMCLRINRITSAVIRGLMCSGTCSRNKPVGIPG